MQEAFKDMSISLVFVFRIQILCKICQVSSKHFLYIKWHVN